MWSSKPISGSMMRFGVLMAGLGLLSACADDGEKIAAATPAAPQAPAPDYATATEHFAGLQRAGLSARYADFAKHLKPSDPKTVTDALQRSFRGRPFDVYTRKYAEKDGSFQRLVELRSTSGRLYLYVELDRVPGGWVVSDHDLSRRGSAILARL